VSHTEATRKEGPVSERYISLVAVKVLTVKTVTQHGISNKC